MEKTVWGLNQNTNISCETDIIINWSPHAHALPSQLNVLNERLCIETIPIKLLSHLMIALMITVGLFPKKIIAITSSMIEQMMIF